MQRFSSIFSQLLQLFPRLEFEEAVKKHRSDYSAKTGFFRLRIVFRRFRSIAGPSGNAFFSFRPDLRFGFQVIPVDAAAYNLPEFPIYKTPLAHAGIVS